MFDAPPPPDVDLPALIGEFSELVHPATLSRIVRVESGGRVLALNVNRRPGEPAPRIRQPTTVPEAAEIARYWIARGHTVDVGLGQVNSIHLAAMGLTVEQLLEPRTNLRASVAVLSACYTRALSAGLSHGDPALTGALSCYNTGSLTRGVAIGYVARYTIPQSTTALVEVQARVQNPPRILPPRVPVNPRAAIAEADPAWAAAVAQSMTGG